MKRVIFWFISCIFIFLNLGYVLADDRHEMADGEYMVEVTMAGGSGRAKIESPTVLIVKNGQHCIRIIWSSPNYDYMLVDGEKYLNLSESGENSVFEIPVKAYGEPFKVTGDTLAMSQPHEIEYSLTVSLPETTGKSNSILCFLIAAGSVILFGIVYVYKKQSV